MPLDPRWTLWQPPDSGFWSSMIFFTLCQLLEHDPDKSGELCRRCGGQRHPRSPNGSP
jgi:hypothetical protein